MNENNKTGLSHAMALAMDTASQLDAHHIPWTLTAGSAGTVVLAVSALPISGTFKLKITTQPAEFAGDPQDPHSVRITPEGRTELTILAVLPGAGLRSCTNWRLSVCLEITSWWITNVVAAASAEILHRPAVSTPAMYEKCQQCHLFVEPNHIDGSGIAAYVHLHRGNDSDTRLDENHAAVPSGEIHPLDYWRVHGPAAMRARFGSPAPATP